MATCRIDGVNLMFDRLSKEASRMATHGKAAVMAGAKVFYDEMQRTIPKRTGETAKHMYIKEPDQIQDGWSTVITYEGKRSDGERYGEIAFVNEYGRSNMAAQPFVRPARERKAAEAKEAIRAELLKD